VLSASGQSYSAEAGFSVIKLLFWLALIGFVVINGASLVKVYYVDAKVQGSFEELTRSMPVAAEPEIRAKMHEVFHVQYLDEKDLPDGFYDALQIHTTGHGFEISSSYHVTIWPFGSVKTRDEQGEYAPDDLTGLDILRHKTRIDLSFEPNAISEMENQ